MQFITLNNGVKIPQLGYGVWKIPNEQVTEAVNKAIKTGYRLIDTAMIYQNEVGVGKAIANSEVPREELFITTKIWNKDQGYDKTLKAFETSMKKLGLDYLDLYLIHWPAPRFNLYVETYKALEKLYKEGLVRSIGVCNFEIEHLERILNECEVVPVVNQVECHPYLQQKELEEYCKSHNIILEAYSPLMNGRDVLNDEIINGIADQYRKSAAQVILRWLLQRGQVVLTKSVTPSRIKENFDVLNFELSLEHMEMLDKLDRNIRVNFKPSEFHNAR